MPRRQMLQCVGCVGCVASSSQLVHNHQYRSRVINGNACQAHSGGCMDGRAAVSDEQEDERFVLMTGVDEDGGGAVAAADAADAAATDRQLRRQPPAGAQTPLPALAPPPPSRSLPQPDLHEQHLQPRHRQRHCSSSSRRFKDEGTRR